MNKAILSDAGDIKFLISVGCLNFLRGGPRVNQDQDKGPESRPVMDVTAVCEARPRIIDVISAMRKEGSLPMQ